MAVTLDVLQNLAARVPRLLEPDGNFALLRFLMSGSAGTFTDAVSKFEPVGDMFEPIIDFDDAMAFDSVRRCAIAPQRSWTDDDDDDEFTSSSDEDGDLDSTQKLQVVSPTDQLLPHQRPARVREDAHDATLTPWAADDHARGADSAAPAVAGRHRGAAAVKVNLKRPRTEQADDAEAPCDSEVERSGLWKLGSGPVPTAVLVRAADSTADLAATVGASCDLCITVPINTSPHLLAEEFRAQLTTLARRFAVKRERRRQTAQGLRSHRTEPVDDGGVRPVVTVLVVVPTPSVFSNDASGALKRLVSECVRLQDQYRPYVVDAFADPCFPAAHVAVIVTVPNSQDAIKARDVALLPLRFQLRVATFGDAAATDDAFAAFLMEAMALFPVVLTSRALRLLRDSWDAAHRLSDVCRNLHAMLSLSIPPWHSAGRGEAVDMGTHGWRRPPRVSGESTKGVQLCLNAAMEASASAVDSATEEHNGVALQRPESSYVTRCRAFEAFYTLVCDGNTASLLQSAGSSSSARRALGEWMRERSHTLPRLDVGHLLPSGGGAVDLLPLINCPAAPVSVVSQFHQRLSQLTEDLPASPLPASSTASVKQLTGLWHPLVSDAARVLAVLTRECGNPDAPSWLSFDVVRGHARLSEERFIRALFDLRTRQLAAANLTRRTARCATS
jgi:hypothetical protein